MVRTLIKHLLVAKTGTGNPLTNVTFPRADAIGAWGRPLARTSFGQPGGHQCDCRSQRRRGCTWRERSDPPCGDDFFPAAGKRERWKSGPGDWTRNSLTGMAFPTAVTPNVLTQAALPNRGERNAFIGQTIVLTNSCTQSALIAPTKYAKCRNWLNGFNEGTRHAAA